MVSFLSPFYFKRSKSSIFRSQCVHRDSPDSDVRHRNNLTSRGLSDSLTSEESRRRLFTLTTDESSDKASGLELFVTFCVKVKSKTNFLVSQEQQPFLFQRNKYFWYFLLQKYRKTAGRLHIVGTLIKINLGHLRNSPSAQTFSVLHDFYCLASRDVADVRI